MSALRLEKLLPAALLAAGIALGGFFIGRTLYLSKVAVNTAEVKGLAERRVEADLAYWRIEYSVAGPGGADVAGLYRRSGEDQKLILDLLVENGFTDTELKPGVINLRREEYRDSDQRVVDSRVVLDGSIEVQTTRVHELDKVRARLNDLVARGLDIRNPEPAYYFTGLNTIKPEMLKEATTNARLAADEFASNAGVTVGGIQAARQGSFVVTDAGEEYEQTRKIQKDVRVVTTITFYLTD